MEICKTLELELREAEKKRSDAYIREAVRDTIREITGYDLCPYGAEDSRLSWDLDSYTWRHLDQTWLLKGPWPEGVTPAEQVFRSLRALLPIDAHHFWLWPYYNELKQTVTFFPDFSDQFADHKMCQPYYWEGTFTGNPRKDGYRTSPTMTLKAMYTFPLMKDWQKYLRKIVRVDPPIAITLRFDIRQSAWKFPGLTLDKVNITPAGKYYAYKGYLQGWNHLWWHGGVTNYGKAYPHYAQTFWNACAEGDCDEEWK